MIHSLAAAVAEHGGRSLWAHATTLASYAWLVVIGIPETFTHFRTFVRCCRDWARRGQTSVHDYWNNSPKEG